MIRIRRSVGLGTCTATGECWRSRALPWTGSTATRPIVQRGLDNIERWTRQNGGDVPRAHAEWRELIECHTWTDLRAILLQENDEEQRLRSSHPLAGIITQEERNAILAKHPAPPVRKGSTGCSSIHTGQPDRCPGQRASGW